MASVLGDPFDGDSPPLIYPDGDDDYEALLGTQTQIDGYDLSMSDLQDLVPEAQLSINEPEVHIKTEDGEDTAFLWEAMQERVIELSDSEDESEDDDETLPQEENGDPSLTASARLRLLLANDTEHSNSSVSQPRNSNSPAMLETRSHSTGVIIKQESPPLEGTSKNFTPGEVIDLSDTDMDHVVSGSSKKFNHGTTLSDGTILLSDAEDESEEIIIYDDGSSSVVIKKENADVQFVGASKGLGNVSDSDEDSLPHSPRGIFELANASTRPQRPPLNVEKMREIQQMIMAKARARRVTSGAGGVFTVPGSTNLPHASTCGNNNSWMTDTSIPEERPANYFAELKRNYKAKRKARKNTIEDDIKFQKAEKEEEARRKRLELAYLQECGEDASDDEAEESDDGLFVPQAPTKPDGSNKRKAGGVNDDEGIEPSSTNNASPKKRKTKDASKRTRAELKEELVNNMLAGIEVCLSKGKSKEKGLEDQPATKKSSKGRKKNSPKETPKEPKGKGKAKKGMGSKRPRPTQAGYMNDSASLLTSNVYEDANANLDKQAMPAMTDKRKKQAMASLIASIPLENQREAASEKEHIVRMTRVLGHVKASEDGKGWNMKGMTQVLHHHQVQGAGTMKDREIGADVPLGGILADEMGFGKSVMTIMLTISNPPSPLEEHKSTLIVCSPAIISQWDDEIAKHTKAGVFHDIIRHHGSTKISIKGASGRNAPKKMQSAQIVLTTYSEVIKSYPKCKIPDDIEDPDEKKRWWLQEWEKNRGLLHRVQFYRVVLDEAQAIKNHQSQTSVACRGLMAKHRWAISGTPILNDTTELYPLFKFLRIPHTGSYRVFKQNFCIRGSKVCNQRLHSFLDKILIRRTYKSTLFKLPIIKMPEMHQNTIALEFNSVERKIYDIIHMRFVRAINKASAEGLLEKRSRLVLSMLLRLRQAVSHTFMLQETMENFFELEDIEALWAETSSEVTADEGSSRDMMKSIRKMIEAKDDTPIEADEDDGPQENTEQGAALIFKFRKYLRQLKSGSKMGELKERSLCHLCKTTPDDPRLTTCLHLYCNECLLSMAHEAAANDEDSATCVACNEIFSESHPCSGLEELEVEEQLSPPLQDGKLQVRPKRTAKDNMKWVEFDGHVLPSTKTAAVQAQIEKWLKEEPNKKIIVFSQFHLVMQVLGKVCERQNWKYCTYHGKMSHSAREESIEQFRNDPERVIMIASLKCGGIGLNLTMASKVICVDLWFNSLIEMQGEWRFPIIASQLLTVLAFCRVFRIGQVEETHLTRFVIKETIDERLLKMQKRKDKIIGAAMDDRSVLSKLTLEDMMSLFGDVVHDANAKPFIFTEDDPEIASLVSPHQDEEEEEDSIEWDA